MQTTANYALKKPEGTDVVDIQNFNDNADIIDSELKKRALQTDFSSHLADNTAHGVGDRSKLLTTDKDSFVNAINEVFTSANNSLVQLNKDKDSLYTAIVGKGITPTSKDIPSLITGINSISRGQGNAVESQVLSGVDFTNSDGKLRTGTMSNNGAINITPSGSAQTIPAGYISGGSVSAVSVPVANVLSGTTIAGQVGTMKNNGAVTITPGINNQSIPGGYHNGNGYVKGEPNLKSENIPEGMSMFGIAGNLTPIPSLTAGDIVIYDDDSFYNFHGSSSYIKICEKTIKTSGTIRIRFDMKGDINTAGYYAFGKIYINGIARGTQRSTNALQNWFTEDFTVSKGDKIQLYGNGSSFQNTHIYFQANVNPLFE